MRRLISLCCVSAAFLLTSCYSLPLGPATARSRLLQAPVQPPLGGIYTHYRAPLMTDLDKTPATASKTGRATTIFLRLFYPGLDIALDDASIEAAARDGGITRIHYADYDLKLVLGLYGEFTTIVHGE